MFSAVRRHPNVVHIDHVPDVIEERGRFGHTHRRLWQATEGRQIACSWYELPPRKQAFPHHYHSGVEEAVYVLEGGGAARIGDERIPIAAGDYIAYPPGPASAHSIINTSDAPLRYLCMSTVSSVDVIGYPDSRKLRVIGGRDPSVAVEDQSPWIAKTMADPPEADYYDGEDTGEPADS